MLHNRNIDIPLSEKKANEARELMRANAYIKLLTKKLTASQQKYKKLQEQATSLAFLIKQLQGEKNNAESLEVMNVIEYEFNYFFYIFFILC